DDLEHVDAIERVEDARRQLGPPAEAYAIAHHQLPQPPHPPPPPPQPPLPQPPELPQLEPEAVRSRKSPMKGNAPAGAPATPNRAVSHRTSRDPLPGRSDAARLRRPENIERIPARTSSPARARYGLPLRHTTNSASSISRIRN